jgi:hypothetical protein
MMLRKAVHYENECKGESKKIKYLFGSRLNGGFSGAGKLQNLESCRIIIS